MSLLEVLNIQNPRSTYKIISECNINCDSISKYIFTVENKLRTAIEGYSPTKNSILFFLWSLNQFSIALQDPESLYPIYRLVNRIERRIGILLKHYLHLDFAYYKLSKHIDKFLWQEFIIYLFTSKISDSEIKDKIKNFLDDISKIMTNNYEKENLEELLKKYIKSLRS